MRNPIKTRYRSKRAESGAQLVELAIVLPIFLMLLAAVAEFGLYFYTYTTLSKATRVAARYITSKPYNPNNPDNANNTIAQAKKLAVCGRTDLCSAGSEIISGFTTSNVSITTTGGDEFFPETITVQISGYNYSPLFDLSGFVGGQSWQNVSVAPSTTMRYLLAN